MQVTRMRAAFEGRGDKRYRPTAWVLRTLLDSIETLPASDNPATAVLTEAAPLLQAESAADAEASLARMYVEPDYWSADVAAAEKANRALRVLVARSSKKTFEGERNRGAAAGIDDHRRRLLDHDPTPRGVVGD